MSFTREQVESVTKVLSESKLEDDQDLMESHHYQPFTPGDQWGKIVNSLSKLFAQDYEVEAFIELCEPVVGGVDCMATGYEWSCPKCQSLNEINAFREEQNCEKCGQKVSLDNPEHAYD